MSTQVTDAALVEIELDKLTPNPSNLRRSVGDVKALTKSIAEVGIVVPLIVTPAVDGTYLLAAGGAAPVRRSRRGVDHGPVCRTAVERGRADRVHADRERRPKPAEAHRAGGWLHAHGVAWVLGAAAGGEGGAQRQARQLAHGAARAAGPRPTRGRRGNSVAFRGGDAVEAQGRSCSDRRAAGTAGVAASRLGGGGRAADRGAGPRAGLRRGGRRRGGEGDAGGRVGARRQRPPVARAGLHRGGPPVRALPGRGRRAEMAGRRSATGLH